MTAALVAATYPTAVVLATAGFIFVPAYLYRWEDRASARAAAEVCLDDYSWRASQLIVLESRTELATARLELDAGEDVRRWDWDTAALATVHSPRPVTPHHPALAVLAGWWVTPEAPVVHTVFGRPPATVLRGAAA